MRTVLVSAVVLLLSLASASALATGGETGELLTEDPQVEACAPPCGEINPRILFEFPDLSRETLDLSAGDTATFQGTVTYWADTDDEGYIPPDPQEPITIQFSFPRAPPWAGLSISPSQLDLQTPCPTCTRVNADDPSQPTFHYAQSFEVELTVEVLDTPERTPGYDYGKLQLFGKSTESGIWNPGYGIKEVRIQAGDGQDLEQTGTGMDVPGPGLLGLAAALAGAALVAWRRER